jgi:hypothetical protein
MVLPHRLRHLRLTVEAHDAPRGRQQRLRLGEERLVGRRERVVPASRDDARQLEVLHLVLAHRHAVGAIEAGCRRLQDRIVEQPAITLSCFADLSLNCVWRRARRSA